MVEPPERAPDSTTGGSERSGTHPRSPLEMEPEEMRALGYGVVDRLVERWSRLAEERPWVGAAPDEMEELLDGPPPEEGSDAGAVLERAVAEILGPAGRIDHPRFFAFIPSSPTWPSVLGDLLATGFNVFQGTWLESAGPSQIEVTVLDWFRRWTGMPEGTSGILTSGGSAANLVALVTARDAADPPPGRGRIYRSDQGHSSLDRAARIAGLGADAVREVGTDERLRLDPAALRRALRDDRDRDLAPIAVCANAGATNTGAVDPLAEIADVCREESVWLHVDAAYGGFAALHPGGRALLEGMGRADSLTLDPHKWLYQPYEAGCLLVRDVERVHASFRVLPDYLQDAEPGRGEVNFADRGVQLTRAFRALKIWTSVQVFGVRAFRDEIGRTMELARRAAERIRRSPVLELLSPASLGIVCFRARPPEGAIGDASLEALNRRIQDLLLGEGSAMISSTRLRGTYSLRLCIMNYRSRWEDVEAVLARIEELGGAST